MTEQLRIQKPGYKVSFSTLKNLMESNPEKLVYEKRQSLIEGKKDKPDWRLGRMIEDCVFDPDAFYQKYACVNGHKFPGEDTKDYQLIVKVSEGLTVSEAREATEHRYKVATLEKYVEQDWGELITFLRESRGKEVITKSELEMCEAIRDRLHNHKDFKYAISEAEFQKRVEWTDKETGVECKAFLDVYNIFGVHEFKTIDDASDSAFSRKVRRLYWDVQLASQMDSVDNTGTWIVVEKTPPYSVRFIPMSEEDFQAGRTVWRRWLNHWKRLVIEKAWEQGYEFWGVSESRINRYIT